MRMSCLSTKRLVSLVRITALWRAAGQREQESGSAAILPICTCEGEKPGSEESIYGLPLSFIDKRLKYATQLRAFVSHFNKCDTIS